MTRDKKAGPSKGWPPERRKAQAERIRQQQPWTHSTGPRTEAGKTRAALNATTHGMTGTAAQELRDALRTQRIVFPDTAH